MGPPNPHFPSRRKYHTSCGRIRAAVTASDLDSAAASWLIDDHPCYRLAILFFLRSVNMMGALIHSKTMYLMLNAKIFQLAEVIRVVFLKYRDRAAVTGYVNPLEAGIIFDNVATIRDRQGGDYAVFVEIDHRHQIVVFTNQERAAV